MWLPSQKHRSIRSRMNGRAIKSQRQKWTTGWIRQCYLWWMLWYCRSSRSSLSAHVSFSYCASCAFGHFTSRSQEAGLLLSVWDHGYITLPWGQSSGNFENGKTDVKVAPNERTQSWNCMAGITSLSSIRFDLCTCTKDVHMHSYTNYLFQNLMSMQQQEMSYLFPLKKMLTIEHVLSRVVASLSEENSICTCVTQGHANILRVWCDSVPGFWL